MANHLFKMIAKKRLYYGFLASDKLGLNYSLNHQALTQDKSIIKQLNTNNYLTRAKEFYLLGEDLPARREWYQLVKPLNEQQRDGASPIANQWGWHNRTIITLTMTEERDDLDLRFPMP
jgi:soluble lytic murein transglycosylase